MSQYAYIKEIKNGVVFSDPSYDENVWCQYRKAFTDKNWFMQLETKENSGLWFQMMFGRPTFFGPLRENETEDGYRYTMNKVELGIDHACIFFGNMKDFKEFGESIAFDTGGDGYFGNLYVFTVKGEENPAGFILIGEFAASFMTKDELFNHLLSSFEGEEISQYKFIEGVSPVKIENKMLLATEIQHAQSFTAQPQNKKETSLDSPEL